MQNINSKRRPKTGAMRFKNDWPGLFVRGDDCMHLSHAISEILAGRTEAIVRLKEIAKIIDDEVLAGGGRT